ncbi:Holliday junction DNA helicase subunit RuvA [Desulfacinum hydrothermale DSM 13146]|uniref:Holliday junction branch migration complex subunit RuvA n=1 Tax=Desulfacinum hydrothermale DSM 13146 TaxID=1121390 RepID=A0A1W1WYS4_9BACT|nr:Holliday junction branch migration protein RuvA [Desulfacinum hydrothermale]SMC16784.1 Holliday junction DNA helicase subunit RuvA [Desulfacinum hydrothermale DSM 13146]
MIAHLEGILRHKAPDHVIVDVHGVGYRVQVPLSTFYHLPETGAAASLHVHTHVREDALQLFGFHTAEEKEMFTVLIAISGVGPRLALTILSGIQPDELRRVVQFQERQRLQKIPGIGKKTAERILLELKDRLKLQVPEREAPPAPSPPGDDGYADALSALVNLGYRPTEAAKALKEARKALADREGTPSLEVLLREAFRSLG